MENRDAIIRKLNALRAKANGASTPEEAIAFLSKYNELMDKYKLTETDLEVKSSKVEGTIKTPAKEFSLIERVCNRIATLSDTIAVKGPEGIAFVGLRVDVDYASWIFDLVHSSLENGYRVLPMGALYHRLLNNKVKPKAIKENYKIGFLTAIAFSLDTMIAAKKVKGNALVVVKHDIILAYINENGGMKETKDKVPVIYDGAHELLEEGFEQGSKVKLSQSVESVVKGYLS